MKKYFTLIILILIFVLAAGITGYALERDKYLKNNKLSFFEQEINDSVEAVSGKNTPSGFNLYQNYPNPFNPSTIITFAVPENEHVKIVVYSLIGEMVKVLADNTFNAGTYKTEWDGTGFNGSHMSSGVYFYSLETPGKKIVKKMILSK